ncbi:DHH family phosphoesterase, partial [Vibrio sp.]|nr:DHH family phosphoesterase [Vibrio sp.]
MIEITRRPESDMSSLPTDIPEILRRIYAHRGITQVEQLDRGVRSLHSYQELNSIELAVELLFESVQKQKRIIVVGDFDADGATSSALSVLALRMLGSHNVDYLVPNRFEDGYGLSPEVVDQAITMQAEVIMTVDNGVSSIEGVRYAKQNGITVIVTDHHLPGDILPDADAMVNPNLDGCHFPSKSLAGVGVAFYLMMALCVYMRKNGWFKQQGMAEPKLMELVDLVALG